MPRPIRKNSALSVFEAGVAHHKAELLEERWLAGRLSRDIKGMAECSEEIARLRAEAAARWTGYPKSFETAMKRARTERELAALPTVAFDPADDLFGGIMCDLPPAVSRSDAALNVAKIDAYLDADCEEFISHE